MIHRPFVRSAYNYDLVEASEEAAFSNVGEDCPVQQSFRDECDINVIMERFGQSGELPSNVRVPMYGDFEAVGSFHDAMNAVALAQESFEAMPAAVRSRFHNDPGEFVDFCNDPANLAEMRKMGLAVTPEVENGVSSDGSVGSAVGGSFASSEGGDRGDGAPARAGAASGPGAGSAPASGVRG